MTLTPEMLNCQVDANNSNLSSCQNLVDIDSGQPIPFIPPNPLFTWQLDSWSISADVDPFVNQAFGFTNTGVVPAVYTLTTSIPTIALAPSSLAGGSSGGSVTDANANAVGGFSTVAPDPFFVGLIDGVPVPGTELHLDPTLFPGPGFPGVFAFPGQTVNIPAVTVGLPGPTVPAPAVAGSIGIRNRFALDAGDSVGATNFFQVEVVPEPGSALLLGIGLVWLAALRRSAS